jgi:hypothetical protein
VDGNGWGVDYMGRLLKYYPRYSMDEILDDLPMILGWVLINFSMENDAWLQFAGLQRSSRGYIGQEIDELMRQVVKENKIK